MFRSLQVGVRGRLLLAFFGISAFAVVAAGAAIYAFGRAGEVLEQITQQRLPPALASLELSRQAERVVGAAPALLGATNQDQRETRYQQVAAEVARLIGLLEQLEEQAEGARDLIRVRLAPLVDGLELNLDDLNFLVEQRLALGARKAAVVAEFEEIMRSAERLVAPGGLLVDSAVADWSVKIRGGAPGPDADGMVETLLPLLPQRKAEVVIHTLNGRFLQVALAPGASEADMDPIERSLGDLKGLVPEFPKLLQPQLRAYASDLESQFSGTEGLIEIQEEERDIVGRALRVLEDNGQLAEQMTAAVDSLVTSSKGDIRDASLNALEVQEASAAILIAVVAASLISSALIVWLYVNRNLVARLTGLSDSMLALAGGDLRTDLPPAGAADEIGRMAEALRTFRNTALVVEENNLREIAHARQRLIDAIESISDGFAFYDTEDRLELANTRYHELLHAGAQDNLRVGLTFEEIIRTAADRGSIKGTEGDREGWIQERLARHRDPGEPHVQRRSDGRWIQVSERRIEGGGQVAIYSDITELKEREQELNQKSRLLETTLENMSQGLTMFDEDLRMIVVNRRFLELLDFPPGQFKLGDHLEAMFRYNAERGEFGPGDIEEQVQARLQLARKFEAHQFERPRPDGRTLEVVGTPVPGAGFVTTYTDVTELRQREDAVKQSEQRLIDAIESISEGFCLYGPDDHLVLSNSRYKELYPGYADIIEPGVTFEQVVRAAAGRGVVQEAFGRPDEWIAERLAAHRAPSEPSVQPQSDGRWIQISERQTHDGGTVGVYTDITELKNREAALAEERERLARTSERLGLALSIDGVGIWDADLEHNEMWWSDEYISMMGHEIGQFAATATSWEEHLHPDNAKEQIDAVDRWLAGQENTFRATQRMTRGDGRDIWVDTKMRVQRRDDGSPIRLAGLDVDVTEPLERERQLQKANQRISDAAAEIERKNQELEGLSSKLAKYLSPQVYDSIFTGQQEVKIDSRRKKLTVFFSDIAGFTETTDKLESEELTQLLNQYLTEMSRVALDHGATIDKYVGDAIMTFFGDPESRGVKEDALACVKMAIAMQRRLSELESMWRDAGFEQPLRCRIGINTGYCTVGNFGSEDRMDYTIIGGGVNLASRLESAAPPGGILISYETFALVKDLIRCEERGRIEVKGIAYPVATYEVIDLHENLSAGRRLIRTDHPNVKIALDPMTMSGEERIRVVGLLQQTLAALQAHDSATVVPVSQ